MNRIDSRKRNNVDPIKSCWNVRVNGLILAVLFESNTLVVAMLITPNEYHNAIASHKDGDSVELVSASTLRQFIMSKRRLFGWRRLFVVVSPRLRRGRPGSAIAAAPPCGTLILEVAALFFFFSSPFGTEPPRLMMLQGDGISIIEL
jgi:hypothetical protein